MSHVRSLLVALLTASSLFACADERDENDTAESARLAAEKEGPCGVSFWRIEQALSKCGVLTRYFNWRGYAESGQTNAAENEGIADCYEAASCDALEIYESVGFANDLVVETLGRCVQDVSYPVAPSGPACTPPALPAPEEDGMLKVSDPQCRSGRSVCAYKQAKEREYCSDCRAQCAQTYGSRCDVSKACSGSCYAVECDADDEVRCSDFLENL